MDLGTYTRHDGRPAVRFERTYPHPIERVWAAVSEPEQLAAWFPSSVHLEAREGGTIEFSDDPNLEPSKGIILAYDPPHQLAFTWGGDELHLELTASAGGCTLTLTNVLEASDTAARNAAGWTVCLAELDKHVSGDLAAGPHSETAEAWQPIYQRYVDNGMPHGAPIPGEPQSSNI